MPRPSHTLVDGVVVLSPLGWDDVEPHLAGEDAELVRWLNGGPGTLATVRAHVRRAIERWADGGPKLSFGIRVEDGAVLAGTIDVDLDHAGRRAALAYGIYPAFRRRGLATRAVRLASRYLGERGDVQLISIDVDPANTASIGVARRAGFRFTHRVQDDGGGFARYELIVRAPVAPAPPPTWRHGRY
ncbi:GNAT family N-acetyltransferase [Pseudonocardia sp. HH130630-07]|uniref:GNAT family N-acetyltransferase n=1 Tax=Pseudonocardia sp. HH130630-07 TaxID=1690815 RepID=UPI000B097E64|nr:GNAT family N-acetyltransferase [Pseudonocardia sp. HH130630-07]